MWNDGLSQLWTLAWLSRNVEQLVWIFGEGAFYEDVTFSRKARGRAEMRMLFSELFHTSDLSLKIVSSHDDESREVVLDWIRSGSRIPGIAQNVPHRINLPRCFDFHGTSRLEIVENAVLTCSETWKKEDLESAAQHALWDPARPISKTQQQGIYEDKDGIWIGDVMIRL